MKRLITIITFYMLFGFVLTNAATDPLQTYIHADKTLITPGDSVNFDVTPATEARVMNSQMKYVTVTNLSIKSYSWKIDGVEVATTKSFTHTFNNLGTYTVEVSVAYNPVQVGWRTYNLIRKKEQIITVVEDISSAQGIITVASTGAYTIYQDLNTKLYWTFSKPAKTNQEIFGTSVISANTSFTWEQLIKYCNALDIDGGGWRLPNINELYSFFSNERARELGRGQSYYVSSTTFLYYIDYYGENVANYAYVIGRANPPFNHVVKKSYISSYQTSWLCVKGTPQ